MIDESISKVNITVTVQYTKSIPPPPPTSAAPFMVREETPYRLPIQCQVPTWKGEIQYHGRKHRGVSARAANQQRIRF